MIELDNINIKYGELEVVRPMSLRIEKGEFFTLLGPSGCGKTTMLRAIAGFVPIAGGSITIDGKDVSAMPPEKRDVGIVFQNYALFPHMTVSDNVRFGLKVAKTAKAKADSAVQNILEATGIAEHAHKKPAELSGGQQQRVAIARSLVMGTQILLFDEPLSNLDARVREDMRHEIKRLQRELGFTAVFVTHDQEEALSMSDRLLVFNKGLVEQVGTSRELYNAPATPFVCDFIGGSNRLGASLCQSLELSDTADHFVRPEHIHLAVENANDSLTATIADIDYLGLTTRVSLKCQEEDITCVVFSKPEYADLRLGQQVGIMIDRPAIHSFPQASE